ncbi:MAG: aminotransferase class IV [Spirochaetaceae bacterium]|nr:aminotransferase class IV [Spirochaetaceae bacterium]
MPLLVETLKAVDGRFDDLTPHHERMARSRLALFGLRDALDLEGTLEGLLLSVGGGIWKIRVLYDTEIRSVEAGEYRPRPYRSAALLDGGDVEYADKTADRPELDELTRRAHELGADTALIVKNGLVTDFSYANAAFFDGMKWWTPARPLLEGTRRMRLLGDGRLSPAEITPAGIHEYSLVSPVNAMLDLGEVTMKIDCIIGGIG